MPITPGRSSKDWSASALERDRAAKAEAARQESLQAQIATLLAQSQEAAENAKRHEEQAADDTQQAKNTGFYEISLVQQEKFRSMLADDVFTRVAQTFTKDEDFEYVTAIGKGRPGYERTTELKAMLWDAVAGDDPAFLQQAAQNIACRRRLITDEDILAIEGSVSCLNANLFTLIQSQADTCGEEVSRDAAQEDPRGPNREIQPETQSELQTPEITTSSRDLDALREPQSSTMVNGTLASTARYSKAIKLEAVESDREKRNLMDVLEQDTMPTVRADSVANSDINIQLTDPLGNVITGEEPNLIERTPTHEAEPETPTSTTHKRPLEDDDGTPTPSEVDGTSASKKRKTTRSKSTAKSTTTKFQDYIRARFRTGALRGIDLACSVCGQEAEKPRYANECHHVYCNNCFNTHKGGAKGKGAHNTVCARRDCGSAVGVMSAIAETVIRDLRATYMADNDVQGVHGNTKAENNQDDEMTDEEH